MADKRSVPNLEMSSVRACGMATPSLSKSVRLSSAALLVGPEGMPRVRLGGGGGAAEARKAAACCACKSSVWRAAAAAAAAAAMVDFSLLPAALNDTSGGKGDVEVGAEGSSFSDEPVVISFPFCP